MIGTALSVAAGGAIGATLRWGVGLGAGRLGMAFPVGTLSVNVLGAMIMGLVVALAADRGPAPFVTTGLLGGFTTFSTFSLDAVRLAERGAVGLAALYVGLSVALALLGLIAGLALGRAVAP